MTATFRKLNIPFSKPDLTINEIEEITKVVKSGWITTGPETKLFEQMIADYIGINKAVALNSATASLELTLRILGVGEGDEVITSAYTYTASAAVINHVGAKIVLVDTAPESYEMDYEALEKAITEKTKAIIPVDIGGKMCDYNQILKIVEDKRHLFKPESELQKVFNRVIVIADSAHGFGASQNGRKSGTAADFTCFSFHAVKNLTTAEGGAVIWKPKTQLNNEWLYEQYMLYSLHGQSKDAFHKIGPGSWEYDISCLGYKCNMTDIQAGLGVSQLQRYDEMLERRHEIIECYNRHLSSLGLNLLEHRGDKFSSSGHLYLVRVPGLKEKQRNRLIEMMATAGIATNVHYKPLPMFTAYKEIGFDIRDFPNAFSQYQNEITLPLYTSLSNEAVDYISSTFKKSLRKL